MKSSYCIKCVYPQKAVNLNVDKQNICSACRFHEKYESITDEKWNEKQNKLKEIIAKHKQNDFYDCIIPVSGGKDSYFQTHVIVKELGLNPLLVTYHGNNFLPEGDYNRDRMREVFNVDHIVVGPGIETLKKLNRSCFKIMGDMNWHAHCGIYTLPFQIAVKYKIPLLIYGETWWDISGMFDTEDYAQFNRRMSIEFDLRGYEWFDLMKIADEKLNSKELNLFKFPEDQEILENEIKGICIGDFYKWQPNENTIKMKELYGWKELEGSFQRTYRKFSNLDDRYENGIHDLLKFIKFGYGRATDHASKDIRSNSMSREEGIEMVKKYDHIVSDDLYFWLKYVDMKESEFWNTADKFRDKNTWSIVYKNGPKWSKNNIWGGSSLYGEVHLSSKEIKEYEII